MQYVLLNNQKVRVDSKIYTFDEIKDKQNYGVLIPSGYVMIDFDNMQYAEIFEQIVIDLKLKCMRVNTDRGKHFIFKYSQAEFTNWNHSYTFIGLECDAKGNGTLQNKICYECLCRDGILRDVKYYNSTNNDDIQELPRWLYMNKKGRNLRLSEGDGRNEVLFSYQIDLINNHFTIEECKYISKEIINKYVFIDKLSNSEIDTILRPEAFEKISKDKPKFELDKFIEDMLLHEPVYKYGDNLIWFINDGYTSDEEYKIPGYVARLTKGSNLSSARIGDVMLKLKQSLDIQEKLPDPNYIVCGNNKLYNVMTGDLINNNKEIFSIIDYDYEFNESSSDDLISGKETYGSPVKDFIYYCSCNRDGTFDKEKEKEILQMIGNSLIPNKSLNRCYFIKGNGANGKSKLKILIERLTRGHNSYVMVDEFSSDFKRAPMFLPKVTCNLQDDFSGECIRDMAIFKSIITGATLVVNPKFGKPSTKKCGATLIICTNEWPRFSSDDDAIKRRLMFVELENIPKKVNINLENELLNDYDGQEWLFTESLKAITEAFKKGELIEVEKSKQLQERRLYDLEPIVEFLFDKYYKGDLKYNEYDEVINSDFENIDINLKSTQELLQEYAIYSGLNVERIPSKNRFTRVIKKYLGKYYVNVPTQTGDGTKRLWRLK